MIHLCISEKGNSCETIFFGANNNNNLNKQNKIKMENKNEVLTNEIALNVAIGQKVAELLNIKFGKDGRCKTSWGTKTVQGLGACIARIIEEEQKRINS